MINDIHKIDELLKQDAEIEKLNKMLDFLIDQMPCIFDECKYDASEKSKCQKCIRQWLENQIEE